MTNAEKLQKYEEVILRYKNEAREAREHAKAAKEAHRKSDYDFWMIMYNQACESVAEFEFKALCL